MSEKDIVAFLSDDDVVFYVDNKLSSVCPLSKVIVTFGEVRNSFSSMEEAIHFKMFDGKSILDLWDIIYPQIS